MLTNALGIEVQATVYPHPILSLDVTSIRCWLPLVFLVSFILQTSSDVVMMTIYLCMTIQIYGRSQCGQKIMMIRIYMVGLTTVTNIIIINIIILIIIIIM